MHQKYSAPHKRLRILWLSHILPYPPKGGALLRSYNLIREVAAHHHIDLWTFNQSKLLAEYFTSEEEGIKVATEHLLTFINKIHIEPIPIDSIPLGQIRLAITSLFKRTPYTINWLQSKSAERSIKNWIEQNSYDLIHYDTESLSPYKTRSDISTVMDHHNIESHMLLRRAKKERNTIKKLYFLQEGNRLATYEKNNLHQFEHHIVCSKDDKKRLLQIDPKLHVSVIPNGINVLESDPERTQNPEPRLLFIGGLNWYPNKDAMHYFLEQVWPLVKNLKPDVSIDIIGKRPSRKILEHASQDPQIRVHGFVNEIVSFYRNAAVYICPIRDGGGTKLKVLDALAHRVPVVAHPIACEGIEVEHNTHLVIAKTPEDMASSIYQLLDQPISAQKLGDTGYALIKEKYNFKKIGRSLSDLFINVAHRANLERHSGQQ